ncbi:MAG TPA: amidohydrolase family protein [Jatrophihabitans sp.]|nr:amidohydrolase family protein [Jatrophihabitans sp.]
MSAARRIDVHAHLVPPGHPEWLRTQGVEEQLPPWSPDEALAMMDRNDIAAAVLSVSEPGVHFGDDATARAKARELNTYTAEVVAGAPGRFGFFATLTLPDVAGAIAEARHALDELQADGVLLLSNVEGRYLGDEEFVPLLAELDKRAATVFVHPACLPGAPALPGLPPAAVDFPFETTRTAVSLAQHGRLEQFENLKFILPHGGGFLPYQAFRVAPFLAKDGNPASAMAVLRRFYFDTGLCTTPAALPSLLGFADPERVLFGSDYPFVPEFAIGLFDSLAQGYPMDDDRRSRLARDNAAALFPRLAG